MAFVRWPANPMPPPPAPAAVPSTACRPAPPTPGGHTPVRPARRCASTSCTRFVGSHTLDSDGASTSPTRPHAPRAFMSATATPRVIAGGEPHLEPARSTRTSFTWSAAFRTAGRTQRLGDQHRLLAAADLVTAAHAEPAGLGKPARVGPEARRRAAGHPPHPPANQHLRERQRPQWHRVFVRHGDRNKPRRQHHPCGPTPPGPALPAGDAPHAIPQPAAVLGHPDRKQMSNRRGPQRQRQQRLAVSATIVAPILRQPPEHPVVARHLAIGPGQPVRGRHQRISPVHRQRQLEQPLHREYRRHRCHLCSSTCCRADGDNSASNPAGTSTTGRHQPASAGESMAVDSCSRGGRRNRSRRCRPSSSARTSGSAMGRAPPSSRRVAAADRPTSPSAISVPSAPTPATPRHRISNLLDRQGPAPPGSGIPAGAVDRTSGGDGASASARAPVATGVALADPPAVADPAAPPGPPAPDATAPPARLASPPATRLSALHGAAGHTGTSSRASTTSHSRSSSRAPAPVAAASAAPAPRPARRWPASWPSASSPPPPPPPASPHRLSPAPGQDLLQLGHLARAQVSVLQKCATVGAAAPPNTRSMNDRLSSFTHTSRLTRAL